MDNVLARCQRLQEQANHLAEDRAPSTLCLAYLHKQASVLRQPPAVQGESDGHAELEGRLRASIVAADAELIEARTANVDEALDSVKSDDEQGGALNSLLQKCKQLETQVRAVDDAPMIDEFTFEEGIVQNQFSREVESTIQDLSHVLRFARGRLSAVLCEKERKQALLERHTLLKEGLEQRLNTLPNAPTRADVVHDVESSLRAAQSKLDDSIRSALHTLISFVDQHYDFDGGEEWTYELQQPKGRRGSASALNDSGTGYASMKELLQDLMNASVRAGQSPYVSLASNLYFPPHVELLVRAGIAEKHTTNSELVRLFTVYQPGMVPGHDRFRLYPIEKTPV